MSALVVLFGFAHGVCGQVTDARTLHGQVVDQQGNQIKGGVVYLRSLATQIVRSYISDDEGQYRFSGLDPNADYEIHAETPDQTSERARFRVTTTAKISCLILRVDKKKSDK